MSLIKISVFSSRLQMGSKILLVVSNLVTGVVGRDVIADIGNKHELISNSNKVTYEVVNFALSEEPEVGGI